MLRIRFFLLFIMLLFLFSTFVGCSQSHDGLSVESLSPVDPADTRSQEEILIDLFAQTDGPVVVQIVSPADPFIFIDDVAPIWNAPHVINVICPSIVHWIDITEKGSLCMIGQYLVDLDPAAISEGRWYEDETECCVNRAEYERLLADPEDHFTGIGDNATYTEQITEMGGGFNHKTVTPISKTFTVVGVVGEEEQYADTAYGIHHVYALTDSVAAMLTNYKPHNDYFKSQMDIDAYIFRNTAMQSACIPAYRTNPEDENTVLFRMLDGEMVSEEEWNAPYRNLPCNAGYTVEVTLDSGKNYAVFADYWRSKQFSTMSMAELEERRLKDIETAYELYEKHTTNLVDPYGNLVSLSGELKKKYDDHLSATLAALEQDPLVTQLIEIGELDEWYTCVSVAPYVVHPLRVEE